MDKIHILGDSHVSLFTGDNVFRLTGVTESLEENHTHDKINNFRTYMFDKLRAYHFTPESEYPITRNLLSFLEKKIPPPATLILSIGEVDCRGPILNKHHKSEETFENLVTNCVNNYLLGITYLVKQGYKVILYSPIPNCFIPIKDDNGSRTCPLHLTIPEWNMSKLAAVVLFDKKIKESGVPVISLLNWILKERVCFLDKFWLDTIHLSKYALPELGRQLNAIGIHIQGLEE